MGRSVGLQRPNPCQHHSEQKHEEQHRKVQAEGRRRAWEDQSGGFDWGEEGQRRNLFGNSLDQRKVPQDHPETLGIGFTPAPHIPCYA
ncbi:Uncharacterized protein TCM_011977 [Theobroma cacao]|uniref:Uncharacterized protein n=1 Tax=Theobroma cacao TaxID=3641 RepID=A0A061G0M5_THECC|nr:Uncharacterized protein TCM_011977 [Theobroma cacao]